MRPQGHVTADTGSKSVALQMVKWGWTADAIISDYGEDLNCDVFVDGQRTPFHFRCQVKSTLDQGSVRRLRDGRFSVRLSAKLCQEWLLAFYPVVLVVFDVSADVAYWANATDQLRANTESLTKKTVTLYVSQQAELASQRSDLLADIANFYGRLLRVGSGRVERHVYPILMPGYRALPAAQISEALFNLEGATTILDWNDQNDLPGWSTAIRTLGGHYLGATRILAPTDRLGTLGEDMATAMACVPFRAEEGQWLAWSCGPLMFSLPDDDSKSAHRRELSGWASVARLGDQVVSDRSYAFDPPPGYLRQNRRRARSPGSNFSVSVEDDLALQMWAAVPSTQAERQWMETQREMLLDNVASWKCPAKDFPYLEDILNRHELVFLDSSDRGHPEQEAGMRYGAIVGQLFRPDLGLFPAVTTWRDFDISMLSRLKHGLDGTLLPGTPAPEWASASVKTFIEDLDLSPGKRWLVGASDAVHGLPIDLSDRCVQMTRMRRGSDKERVRLAERLGDALDGWLVPLDDQRSFSVVDFGFGDDDYFAVGAAWAPDLREGSATSILRMRDALMPAFDKVFGPHDVHRADTTFNALRLGGEVGFADDPEA